MKNLMRGLVVLLALPAVSFASGSLGVFGSLWQPKDFDDGYGVSGKLQLGQKGFITEIRAGYFEGIKGTGALKDLEVEVNPFEVGIALRAGDRYFSPFLGAGVGYYLLNGNSDGGGQYQVDDVVGWYAVGGCEFELGEHSSIHFEVQVRDVTGTVEGDDPLDTKGEESLDLSGFVASVGLVIKF